MGSSASAEYRRPHSTNACGVATSRDCCFDEGQLLPCMGGSTERLAAAFPQMLVTSEPIARRWTGAFRPLQQPDSYRRRVLLTQGEHAPRPGVGENQATISDERYSYVDAAGLSLCVSRSVRRRRAGGLRARRLVPASARAGRGRWWPNGAAEAHPRLPRRGATTLIWQTAKDNLRAEAVYERAWAPCARSGSTSRWRSEGRLTRAPAGA